MPLNNPPKHLLTSQVLEQTQVFFLHKSLKIYSKTSSYVISDSYMETMKGSKKAEKEHGLGLDERLSTLRNRDSNRGFLWEHLKYGLQIFHDQLGYHNGTEFSSNSI